MTTDKQNSDFIDFRNYYTGNMSPENKVAFEKHLEEDPFAKEAYEGFLFLKDDHARISAIENTNMALREQFGLKSTTNVFPLKYMMSIAATLVLFLGSYFVIQSALFSKNENLAESHQEEISIPEIIEKESESPIITDSMQKDTFLGFETEENELTQNSNDLIIAEVESLKKKSKQTEKAKTFTPEPLQSKEQKQLSNSNEDESSLGNIEEEVASAQVDLNDKDLLYTNTIYADDSEVILTESLTNKSEYQKGIVAYNESDYTKAIKYFNSSIDQNKKISNSNYYIAMSYFNQNKSVKALKYFDKTINSNSSFKNNAMWYKSLTLLKRGEKLNAKNLLIQISNSNSSFKEAAIKKLESL